MILLVEFGVLHRPRRARDGPGTCSFMSLDSVHFDGVFSTGLHTDDSPRSSSSTPVFLDSRVSSHFYDLSLELFSNIAKSDLVSEVFASSRLVT